MDSGVIRRAQRSRRVGAECQERNTIGDPYGHEHGAAYSCNREEQRNVGDDLADVALASIKAHLHRVLRCNASQSPGCVQFQ